MCQEPGGQQPDRRHKSDTGAQLSGLACSTSPESHHVSLQMVRLGLCGVQAEKLFWQPSRCCWTRACQVGWMTVPEVVFVLQDGGH